MRKFNLFFLLIPALGLAATITSPTGGNWHTAGTWTGGVAPAFGDAFIVQQGNLVCETGQTCSVGTVNTTTSTIGDGTHAATLTINGTMTLRGQVGMLGPNTDCTNNPSVVMGTGATLNLDENGGANPSGFLITTRPCVKFTFGTSGDVCTWGTSSPTCPTNINSTNNGSANGVLLKDSGDTFGTAQINWTGVAINNCGAASTTIAGCFQAETGGTASSWAWKQLYLHASGAFGVNTSAGTSASAPITIDSTISSGRLAHTDVYFQSECNSGTFSAFNASTPAGSNLTAACPGVARSVTNSLIRDVAYGGPTGGGDNFTAGTTVKNTFFDGLGTGSYYTSLTSANVGGGSWSYVVALSDADTCREDVAYTAILAPVADHVYGICVAAGGVPLILAQAINKSWHTNGSLTNAIFDPAFGGASGGGHSFTYGNYGASDDSGYWMFMSNISPLMNPALGYGIHFAEWSSVCGASPVTSITHITQPGTPTVGSFYICENSGVVSTPPVLSTFKGNIFYDSSARINPLMFGNSEAASQPANVVTPTGVDYNANFNFVPFVTTPYTTACTPGPCTNSGGPYAVPMTGSTPGSHDINIAPGLLDNTRNGYTWAELKGQAATSAGFRQAFINDGPSRIGTNIAALFWYINQGNKPTQALWNAMPDQTTIGASQPMMFGGAALGLRPVTQ